MTETSTTVEDAANPTASALPTSAFTETKFGPTHSGCPHR